MIAAVDVLTEDWLREVGFRWHQLERQPNRHWLLWIGWSIPDRVAAHEDLGLELAKGLEDTWFCWLRADTSHRYSRFLHVRHVCYRSEVIALYEALTGAAWKPDNHIGGMAYPPEMAARIFRENDRFDRVLLREHPHWGELERDESRGQALPEHREAYEKGHTK